MNDVGLDVLVRSSRGLRSSDSALHAHLLASEIKSRWDNGERADAWSVLTDHPELLAAKSIVLDLAYEEYCQRSEMGETIDPAQFCERFADYRESLRRLIDVHCYLEQNPQLLPDQSAVRWPQVGETFLGFRLLDLLCDTARIYATAAEQDGKFTETALGYLRQAIKLGKDPAQIQRELSSSVVLKDLPQFIALVQQPPVAVSPQKNLRIVDPVSASSD